MINISEVHKAINLLSRFMKYFDDLKDESLITRLNNPRPEDKYFRIEEINFDTRTINALKRYAYTYDIEIETTQDFSKISKKEMMSLRDTGKKTLAKIEEIAYRQDVYLLP